MAKKRNDTVDFLHYAFALIYFGVLIVLGILIFPLLEDMDHQVALDVFSRFLLLLLLLLVGVIVCSFLNIKQVEDYELHKIYRISIGYSFSVIAFSLALILPQYIEFRTTQVLPGSTYILTLLIIALAFFHMRTIYGLIFYEKGKYSEEMADMLR